MKKFVLVKARDGRIGPGMYPTESFSFNQYEDAVKAMAEDIEEEGGGDYSEDFGNGFSENGFAYEIFSA